MLAVLYLPSGIFIKVDSVFFDPHARVGHLVLKYGMEDLMKYRKFLCRCYRDDRVYTDRVIHVTSVDPKDGIALFRYEEFIPNVLEYFDSGDVSKLSEVFHLMDLLEDLNDLIERSEMGMNVGFSEWVENAPRGYRKALSRFSFSYHRFYRDNFQSLENLRRKAPMIAFSLYEII